MGQIPSRDEPEQLTPEERDTMMELEKRVPVQKFYACVTPENYQLIREHDDIYRKGLGSLRHRMFVLGMKTHSQVKDPLNDDEKREYNAEIQRLLTSEKVAPGDLDEMWALYYATGDMCFPHRIENVIVDENQDLIVREAAKWSYSSHQKQGFLS